MATPERVNQLQFGPERLVKSLLKFWSKCFLRKPFTFQLSAKQFELSQLQETVTAVETEKSTIVERLTAEQSRLKQQMKDETDRLQINVGRVFAIVIWA